VAALAALGTLALGAWVFVFEQILLPAAAPVNITLGLQISRLHQPADGTSPIPVALEASAKNASPKMLMIPKTFLVAHAQGLRRQAGALIGEENLIQDVNRQMALNFQDRSLKGAASRYQTSEDPWDVVAFGPLFDATDIRPQEEIKARRLVFVPPDKGYDLLRVKVVIPSYSRSSWLADDDLIRVTGGIMQPSKDFVGVGFCQAERGFSKHGLRWWFDKFLLPRDRFDDTRFHAPAIRYCPTGMTHEERERIGAQVFTSTYEIDLTVPPQAPAGEKTP
jgi:hypothetical protein